MTDARLKSEWLGAMRFDDLSDTAWRVFTSGLMWSAEQGTDGFIPNRYMKVLHPDGPQPAAVIEIEAAGLWTVSASGVQFADWDGVLGQSTNEQVETYKENARRRQRKWRESERKKLAKASGTTQQSAAVRSPSATGDVTRNATGDVTRRVGTGTGKGEGQADLDAEFLRFWSVWPRKVSKPAAIKEFKAALTRSTPEIIISAAIEYGKHCPDNPQFISYASNWLKNDRWNDPIEATAPPAVSDREWQKFLAGTDDTFGSSRSNSDCLTHPGYPIELGGGCARCIREDVF